MYLLNIKCYNDLKNVIEKYDELKIIPSVSSGLSLSESYKFDKYDSNLRGEFLVLKEKRGKRIAIYPQQTEYDVDLKDFVFYLK